MTGGMAEGFGCAPGFSIQLEEKEKTGVEKRRELDVKCG